MQLARKLNLTTEARIASLDRSPPHRSCLGDDCRCWAVSDLLHPGARRRLAEDVRRLGQGQIIGHATETAAKHLLLHRNGLEEKSFALHLHIEDRHFPKAG